MKVQRKLQSKPIIEVYFAGLKQKKIMIFPTVILEKL